MRAVKIRIRSVKWATGPNSKWVVEGLRDDAGKRIRKFFPSRDAASEWLRERRPELQNQGRAAMGISDGQRVDAVRALAILAPFGATLTQAAKEFAQRAEMLARTVPFAELAVEMESAKKADGASVAYISNIRSKLNAFAVDFGERPVATIESREIDDWLRKLKLSPLTRNNYRRNLSVAFSYAVSRGYARQNPVTDTAEAKVVAMAPGILRPVEFRAMLMNASDELVPSLAIGGFAGLREAEIGRLDWSDVDLAEGYIRIDANKAKTASRRLVPILPALTAWLAPFAQKKGGIHPPKYHNKVAEVRQAAREALRKARMPAPNLKTWPHNALRHSFISYRLASINNAAQVAMEAGHGQAMLHRHYKALVTAAEAGDWFGIMPETAGKNVVSFKRSAKAG